MRWNVRSARAGSRSAQLFPLRRLFDGLHHEGVRRLARLGDQGRNAPLQFIGQFQAGGWHDNVPRGDSNVGGNTVLLAERMLLKRCKDRRREEEKCIVEDVRAAGRARTRAAGALRSSSRGRL